MSNWIERRAARDENLRNASSVWQEARAAIGECCVSYRQHYAGNARVTNTEQNGHRVLVVVQFLVPPSSPREVSIFFSDSEGFSIGVTVDGQKPITFPIDADDRHAFISYQGKEVSADEFVELALGKVLFEPPKSKGSRRAQVSNPHTAWS